MSEMLRKALGASKRGMSWKTYVDFTPEALRKHLEERFVDGMNWEAFMRGEIHIDHVVPQACFRFSTPGDIAFRQCWSLSNLQPLWAKDNIAKGARLTAHG